MRSSTKELTKEEVFELGSAQYDAQKQHRNGRAILVLGVVTLIVGTIMVFFAIGNAPQFHLALQPAVYQLPADLNGATTVSIDQGEIVIGDTSLPLISHGNVSGNFLGSAALAFIFLAIGVCVLVNVQPSGYNKNARWAVYAQAYVEAWLENDKQLPSSDWKPRYCSVGVDMSHQIIYPSYPIKGRGNIWRERFFTKWGI